MYNNRVEMNAENATGWVHVPLQVVHPRTLPHGMYGNHFFAFVQCGPAEPLIHSAIRNGVLMTLAQLRSVQGVLKYPLPDKGKGHGKNGRLIKRDWCQGLVDYLFPDMSEADRSRLVAGLLGNNCHHLQPPRSKSGSSSYHTADILKAFDGLEAEDAKEFSALAAAAKDEALLKERRDRKAREQAVTRRSNAHETPKTLRDLIPPVAGCRLSRHPALRRYQGFYTRLKVPGDGDGDPSKSHCA